MPREDVPENKSCSLSGARHFFVYWIPVILYAGMIFYVSSISSLSELPGVKTGTDTFADMGMKGEIWPRLSHFIEYAFFSLLIFRAASNSKKNILRDSPFLWAVFLTSLFGVSDEIHQLFVPARSCDVLDWVADTLGATFAQVITFFTMKKRSLGVKNKN